MRKLIFALLATLTLASAASAAEIESFVITIENHRFTPSELSVPAGKRIELLIENRDATPEEFESHELNREKVIPGKSTARIMIGPLAKGVYPFVGEFHEETAKGRIEAK